MKPLDLPSDATWIGRVNEPDVGPCVVTLRNGDLIDITSKSAPTVRDILELEDPAEYVRNVEGNSLGGLRTDHEWPAASANTGT